MTSVRDISVASYLFGHLNPGSLFVIKHKGQIGGVNSVRILNTSSSLPASTTMTAVYSGIEWMSLGVSGSN